MRILDLFCGAGGSAMGLHRAFPDAEIVGVDIAPQPHYPFYFVLGDAMAFPLHGYDLIWASPPCQGYSVMRHLPWNRDRKYPLLIEPTRERLRASGVAWIIENVMGAQRKARMGANWLCGTMFGLPFYRHRVFETNFFWMMPGHASHRARVIPGRMLRNRAAQVIFGDSEDARGIRSWPGRRGGNEGRGLTLIPGWGARVGSRARLGEPRLIGSTTDMAKAMGIDWMTGSELRQAIPPAYSRYVAQWIPPIAALAGLP